MNFEQSPKKFAPHMIRRSKIGADKFILVEHRRIHYVESGQGEPDILIPGSYTTYRIWNKLLPLLSAGYRLLALDYRGLGDPDKTAKGTADTLQEQTDLIAKMVRQMELGKVNLIGGASNGEIVFDFAARYPDLVDKIVSIGGGLVSPDKPGVKASQIPWYKRGAAGKSADNIEEAAKSIKTPVLYLYGSKSDSKTTLLEKNLRYLKNNLPHAWIISLEGSIYELALQNPAEVADLILEFLRQKPTVRI